MLYVGFVLPLTLLLTGNGQLERIRLFHGCWVSTRGGSVVAVSVQYRLRLLGFLASSAVMADGSVNVGLLGQAV